MQEKLFEPDYSLETPVEKAKRLGATMTQSNFKICHACGAQVNNGEVHSCSSTTLQLNS